MNISLNQEFVILKGRVTLHLERINMDLTRLVEPLCFKSFYSYGSMRGSQGELPKFELAVFRFKGTALFSQMTEFIFLYGEGSQLWRSANLEHLRAFRDHYQHLGKCDWTPPIAALGTVRREFGD